MSLYLHNVLYVAFWLFTAGLFIPTEDSARKGRIHMTAQNEGPLASLQEEEKDATLACAPL